MAAKRSTCIVVGIFIIAASLFGFLPQTMAETWNVKFFLHTTKAEAVPIPDAEGHRVGMIVREGVSIYDNKELAWTKVVVISDLIKGVGSFSQYAIETFQDGSTMTGYAKGTVGGPQTQFIGEIIHGTGRFQGIKGTTTSTAVKMLPPEKGEIVGKAVGELTITFTLPSK